MKRGETEGRCCDPVVIVLSVAQAAVVCCTLQKKVKLMVQIIEPRSVALRSCSQGNCKQAHSHKKKGVARHTVDNWIK